MGCASCHKCEYKKECKNVNRSIIGRKVKIKGESIHCGWDSRNPAENFKGLIGTIHSKVKDGLYGSKEGWYCDKESAYVVKLDSRLPIVGPEVMYLCTCEFDLI